MKVFLVFLIFALAATAHGAGGDPNSIPTGFVTKQVVHFLGFALVIGFIVKKYLLGTFKTRREEFLALMSKAENAKAEAEKLKTEFQTKINEIEKNKLSTIEQAKSEAQAVKAKIIEEAQESSARLIEDAKSTVSYEVEKAKLELREELLSQSAESAQEVLKQKRNSRELHELDDQFVSKIQVVQ